MLCQQRGEGEARHRDLLVRVRDATARALNRAELRVVDRVLAVGVRHEHVERHAELDRAGSGVRLVRDGRLLEDELARAGIVLLELLEDRRHGLDQDAPPAARAHELVDRVVRVGAGVGAHLPRQEKNRTRPSLSEQHASLDAMLCKRMLRAADVVPARRRRRRRSVALRAGSAAHALPTQSP